MTENHNLDKDKEAKDNSQWWRSSWAGHLVTEENITGRKEQHDKEPNANDTEMPWWRPSWAGHLVTEENLEGTEEKKE